MASGAKYCSYQPNHRAICELAYFGELTHTKIAGRTGQALGRGLIGSKLVNKLREHGHEAVAASPNSGVSTPLVILQQPDVIILCGRDDGEMAAVGGWKTVRNRVSASAPDRLRA